MHKAINDRFSPRSFTTDMIHDAAMNELLEAARSAPSSYNEQPWRMVVAKRGSDVFNRIVDNLMPGNQPWAKFASHLIVWVSKTMMDRTGGPNRFAMYDVGQAAAYFTLQASSRGIQARQMGGFRKDAMDNALRLPDGFESAAVMAVGYPDAVRPKRERKPLEELILTVSESEGVTA